MYLWSNGDGEDAPVVLKKCNFNLTILIEIKSIIDWEIAKHYVYTKASRPL